MKNYIFVVDVSESPGGTTWGSDILVLDSEFLCFELVEVYSFSSI